MLAVVGTTIVCFRVMAATVATADIGRNAANPTLASIAEMTDNIEALRLKMEAAVVALDFEEARRCRDQINMIRGGATALEAEQADASDLTRQKPGAMGLGTSQQRMTPPAGWRPPPKPDPMTAGRSSRGSKKRDR